MKVWVDAQLPPALATLLRSEFGLDAQHLLELAGFLKNGDGYTDDSVLFRFLHA